MLTLENIYNQNRTKDSDQLADYILNKIKRDGSAIALENGYIMAGDKCFIINDNFYKRNEAKQFIINLLNLIFCGTDTAL